jgi:hypothetical protein
MIASHYVKHTKIVELELSPLELNIVNVALSRYRDQASGELLWESNMGTAKKSMIVEMVKITDLRLQILNDEWRKNS